MAQYRIVATGPGVPACTERTAPTAGGAQYHRDALCRLHGEGTKVEVLDQDGRTILPDELDRRARDATRPQRALPLQDRRAGKPSGSSRIRGAAPGGRVKARRAMAGLLTAVAFVVALAAIGIAGENDPRGLGKSALVIWLPIAFGLLLAAFLLVKDLPTRKGAGSTAAPNAWSAPSDASPDSSGDYDESNSWGSDGGPYGSADSAGGSSDGGSSSGSSSSSPES